jgi:sulfonate transport system permease protein
MSTGSFPAAVLEDAPREGPALADGRHTADPSLAGLRLLRPEAEARTGGVPRNVRRLTGPVLLIGLWGLGSALGWIPENILPSPWATVGAFSELMVSGALPKAMAVSLQRVAIGVTFGVTIGTLLALLSGLLRLGEDLIDAPMQMIRTLPWAGLIPLLIIWFGIDELPKVALVTLAVALPLYINVYAGIRGVDSTLVEAAKTLGLSQLGLIWHVVLPGALPNALVGLRWALGSAWLALVFAEQVNARAGLGYLITTAREVYRVDIIIVALVVYAGLGLAADIIVRVLERGLLAWRPAFTGT